MLHVDLEDLLIGGPFDSPRHSHRTFEFYARDQRRILAAVAGHLAVGATVRLEAETGRVLRTTDVPIDYAASCVCKFTRSTGSADSPPTTVATPTALLACGSTLP